MPKDSNATSQHLPTRFLRFLGPLVATNLLQALGGTVVTICLGQLLGARALAAAVSFFPLFMCCTAFVIGLGAGSSVLVGQAWGARDPGKVRRVAGAVLVGGLALGCAVAVLGAAVIGELLRLLGTDDDVLPEAVAYARILFLAMPVLFVHQLAAALLRGLGDTATPLRVLVLASGLWLLLTPAFILGWLGLPRLGTASAGWASLIGNSVAVAWLAWHLQRKDHLLAFRHLRPNLRWDAPLLGTVARLGVPTGLFFITSSLADVMLLRLVNGYGWQATAAWGTVNQVMAYVQLPAMSIAIAASVFAAQAIGAGNPEELRRVTRVGLWMNLALTGGLALVVAIASPLATRLFTSDPAVVGLAAKVLRITVWGSLAFGLASVFTGVMRSAGTVRVPTGPCAANAVGAAGHLGELPAHLPVRPGVAGKLLPRRVAQAAHHAAGVAMQAGVDALRQPGGWHAEGSRKVPLAGGKSALLPWCFNGQHNGLARPTMAQVAQRPSTPAFLAQELNRSPTGATAVRRLALSLAFILWNLVGPAAHAGDRCRGDCHGAGLAVLILLPLPVIFAYFWGKKKDGPDLGQLLAYILQSGVIAVCAAYLLLGLGAPRWSAWVTLGIVQYAVFASLIHPRRHAAQS